MIRLPLRLTIEADDRDLPHTTSNCAIANKLKDLGYFRPFVDVPRGENPGVISFGVPAERLRYYFFVRKEVADWLAKFDAWNKDEGPYPEPLKFVLRLKDLKWDPQPMGNHNTAPPAKLPTKPVGAGKTSAGKANLQGVSSTKPSTTPVGAASKTASKTAVQKKTESSQGNGNGRRPSSVR